MLSQKYYEIAVQLIAEKCEINPTIFVFSDDPDWVSNHFKLPFKMRIISHNSVDNAVEDL